jgi:hypothetical protein
MRREHNVAGKSAVGLKSKKKKFKVTSRVENVHTQAISLEKHWGLLGPRVPWTIMDKVKDDNSP